MTKRKERGPLTCRGLTSRFHGGASQRSALKKVSSRAIRRAISLKLMALCPHTTHYSRTGIKQPVNFCPVRMHLGRVRAKK